MHDYAIGDWFHDNRMGGDEYFWRITGIRSMGGETVYDVAFELKVDNELSFRHWGDLSWVTGTELRPVTDGASLIKCKLSDVHREYIKVKREAKRLFAQTEALQQSLILIGTEGE